MLVRHPLHRRLGAWIAVASLAAGIVLPAVGLSHVPDSDVDGLSMAAVVHHATTQFERVIEGPDGEHCVACHLSRALSGAAAWTWRHTVPPPRLSHLRPSDASAIARRDGYGLPPRAPPLPA
jgi:hypothetical protein